MTDLSNLEIWPQTQRIHNGGDPAIGMTQFDDTAAYHPTLRETVLRLSRTSSKTDQLTRGACGMKVYGLDKWQCPAAQLVHQRALTLFKNMLKSDQAHPDDCWGNIYRDRDYCVPHSHIRSQAGVVYLLDPGDEDPKDQLMGKFFIADPRVAFCCQHHPGHMTRLLIPDMKPGSMIIFPGQVMHGVNPYYGNKPRITLSWNINIQPIAGRPQDTFKGKA
jgi:hypothetical protein